MRPWKTKAEVELATLEWVYWFNHQRLLEPIGYILPAEPELNYYRQVAEKQADEKNSHFGDAYLNQIAFTKPGAVHNRLVIVVLVEKHGVLSIKLKGNSEGKLTSQLNQEDIARAVKADSSLSESNSLSKVAILLCTFYGQHYLAEQLDSFEAQSHSNWEAWASDDGSEDDTHAILETYRQKWPAGRLSIHFGPAEGFSANFLSLICKANINANYYAYSDQDDIWENDKLERAVCWLKTIPENIPALYCSRTRLVDMQNNEIGLSPLFSKPPSFANALMQNIGGGNTMVLNGAARALLCEAGENVPVITHDWWTYMVVTGCGGRVFYDDYPSLRYRQHDGNLVGMNATWAARFKRLRMLWQGRFKVWNDSNIKALFKLQHKLTPENIETLLRFANARQMSLIPRLIHLKRSGIYRQTLFGNLGLIAAAIFSKI